MGKSSTAPPTVNITTGAGKWHLDALDTLVPGKGPQ